MKTGVDGRTKVGERVLVVNKCTKKRGSNIIKDVEKIPRWCPFPSVRGVLEEDKIDYSFYNKEMVKDFLGFPLAIDTYYSKGKKYRAKGGWVALILLNSLKKESSKDSNVLVLHAVPNQDLIEKDLAISENDYENSKKIYYVLALHNHSKAIEIVSYNKVYSNISEFDLSKEIYNI